MIFESPAAGRTEQLRGLWKEAFADTDAFLDGFFAYGFSPDRCRCIVKDDQVLSALYWFDSRVGEQRFAYLYAVATAKAARGQGLFSALLADVKQLLAAKGYDGILLHPADEALARMYEKFGFEPCAGVDVCSVKVEGIQSLPPSALAGSHLPRQREALVRQVSAEEYMALRRSYLPHGAVLQEGELLPFLGWQYRFFQGEDFLAAGQLYDGKFYAQEFLGEADGMELLVCALGAEEGIFRTVGDSTPFVWCLPLRSRCVKPRYFAFALD